MVSDLEGFELEEGTRNGVNGAERWGTFLFSILLTEVCNIFFLCFREPKQRNTRCSHML